MIRYGSVATVAFIAGCRGCSSETGAGSSETTPEVPAFEASAPASVQRDGGIDPACKGAALSLLRLAVDPRCAVGERDWAALADAGTSGLVQEARRDGDRIVVSLVNNGPAPVAVPLRYHPGKPELAFSVLAETERHGVLELAPPTSADITTDAGAPTDAHVHSARIVLLPGGAATASITIDRRVVARLDRRCIDDGGDCMPATLLPGHVAFHVGVLVVPLDIGPPARVVVD